MARAVKYSTTPIATGERLIAAYGCSELIDLGVIVPDEMEDAMDNKELQLSLQAVPSSSGLFLSTLNRDNDIAEIECACLGIRLGGRKGEDIGGRIHLAVVEIQLPQLLVIREDDGELGISRGSLMLESEASGAFKRAGFHRVMEVYFDIYHFL